MNISESFRLLLSRIEPLASELDLARSHANSIEARLSSEFTVKKFLIVGSHSRDTAIRSHSDVDYFAVIARRDARWGDDSKNSNTVLANVRRVLDAAFEQTDVAKDGQAIVVGFGRGERSVDVVPAVFQGMSPNGRPVYGMPDGAGKWMPTSPEGHNKYIADANGRSGGKLRGTAQLLKFWRECRSPRVPMMSFHLELLLAGDEVCRVGMSYADCVLAAFRLLARRECRGYPDPLGISGNVRAAGTDAKRTTALAAVQYARDHAASAVDADARGDLAEARRQWDIVFNGAFPW
jgi:hypothetical protein